MPFDRFNRAHRKRARPGPYRSQLEEDIGADLVKLGHVADYEPDKFEYTIHRKYTPDFRVGDFYIEVKGWFSASDRSKLLAVFKANPDLPLFVALQMPNQRLNAKSKTTVAQWCTKQKIAWCPTPIPADFLTQWANGKRPTYLAPARKPGDATHQMVLNSTMTDQSTVTPAASTSGRRKKP